MMRWARLVAAACATAIVFGLVQPAMATPYSMSAGESGVGPFDDIQMFLVSGTVDSSLVFTSVVDNTNSTNWTLTSHSTGWAEASGPASTDASISMGTTFTDVPFAYDLYILLDGTVVDSALVTATASTVAVFSALEDPAASYAADLAANTIPEPSAFTLLGIGLAGIMAIGRRVRLPTR